MHKNRRDPGKGWVAPARISPGTRTSAEPKVFGNAQVNSHESEEYDCAAVKIHDWRYTFEGGAGLMIRLFRLKGDGKGFNGIEVRLDRAFNDRGEKMGNPEKDFKDDFNHEFYRKAFERLTEAKVRFLVGGAYSLHFHTGVKRDTKDLDLFVLPEDHSDGLKALASAGFETVLSSPHWLGKAMDGEDHIDIIFSSGNAIGRVDEEWFRNAPEGRFLGYPAKFVPAEEMIWSKAFVMERERYDGADIMHLLICGADRMDWSRLMDRFGDHWRVLYSYLILFGFVYPSKRALIPDWVSKTMEDLLKREEVPFETAGAFICRGTLLSKAQYRIDIDQWGFEDSRKPPHGKMTDREIKQWSDFRD